MQVIPVIDLKNGLAVHAVKGQREHYAPLQSLLSPSAEPLAVLAGLLDFHPFRTVYVADLDALTGTGSNQAIVQCLAQSHPNVEFWADSGWPDESAGEPPNRVPIMGSESLAEQHLPDLPRRHHKAVLSLDFFGERFTGPEALLRNPALWPQRVILMTLGQVGSQAGPDWKRLEQWIARHPETRWIAAGGVRHAGDLRRLAGMGIHAVLLATALHQGRIGRAELAVLDAP